MKENKNYVRKSKRNRSRYTGNRSRELNVNAEDVKPESRFKEDLNADSLDLFEMVMALEEEFGKEIPTEDLEKIATIGDVVAYLEK